MKNFKYLKARGIITGLLLGFLCIGLYFYPFIPREEILNSAVEKTPKYITNFWDCIRILLLICFEIGMFKYYTYLRQSCEHYRDHEDFDVLDEQQIISKYTYLGAMTVVISGWTALIIQAIAELFIA